MQKKFNPQPGDKIICNNGEEFICCTLEKLNYKGVGSHMKDKVEAVFGISENWEDDCSWMYWQGDNYPDEYEWQIREVIPAESKEVVKEEEPRYTVEEVFYAIRQHVGYESPLDYKDGIKRLLKNLDEDPQYKEYLRLKAIYE